jgi:hypothetical protein
MHKKYELFFNCIFPLSNILLLNVSDFPVPAEMSLTKLSLVGKIIPSQGEFGL